MSALLRQDVDGRVGGGGFGELRRLVRAVGAWNTASEGAYLHAGAELQAVFGKVSRVRDGIRASTDAFAGDEIQAMRQGLTEAAEHSAAVRRLAAERGQALAGLQSAIDVAATGSNAVLLVFRLLDYVVLIARTQVEGMNEGQEELGAFTTHTHELVTLGEDVARSIDERVKLLGRHLAEARSIETRAEGGDLIGEFVALAERLDAQQRAAAVDRDAAHVAFTSIWTAIGGIVGGLQFHDTARQRLEHTLAHFTTLDEVRATGLSGSMQVPIPEASRAAAVRRIALLEIAQLDALAELYETKMAEIDGNLARIGEAARDSDAILEHLGRLARGGHGGSLDAEAARLRAHFKQGDAVRQRLGGSLDQCLAATNTLTEMTGKLDDLEHDLKIAGLNAAVRAAHVKAGHDTIGYIARVIYDQATTARVEADRVRTGIDGAVRETRALADRVLPAIAGAEAAIETRLLSATTALTEAGEMSARALTDATAVARQIDGDIAAIRRLMTPHVEGCALMRALAACLAAVAAGCPDADAAPGDMAELDAHLAAIYTMAEERTVFAAVLGDSAAITAPAAEAAPAPGSAEDLDDILF